MDFEVNGELSIFGRGTADPEMMRRLGLSSPKAVIAAAIREDRAADAMAYLEEKFRTVRNRRGIAFTVPMSAMIGGTAYRYLSNQVQEM